MYHIQQELFSLCLPKRNLEWTPASNMASSISCQAFLASCLRVALSAHVAHIGVTKGQRLTSRALRTQGAQIDPLRIIFFKSLKGSFSKISPLAKIESNSILLFLA